jgi:2-polyprenyl-3-methyl-5-hydroxy-6-metoxy-1,4-benzoquinol methylase
LQGFLIPLTRLGVCAASIRFSKFYGVDFFKGKKVLELGCGHGDIGAFFADLGADVLCLGGRIQNINFAKLKHRKVANLKFVQFNLENDFSQKQMGCVLRDLRGMG